MKGVMGLQDFILNPTKMNQRQDGANNADGISFSQFMQRSAGQSSTIGQKPVIGKEERSLLEKSLVHLLNFKLLLKLDKEKTLSSDQLKKLLQKIGGDQDFINGLTPELKAMLQKLLKQLQELGDVKKLDQKALDEMMQIWQMQQEKKRQKQMAEVEELIAAIEARLAVVGVGVKAQIVDKNGEKSVKVSFCDTKSGVAKTLGATGQNEADGQVLSKSLLNRIANFLGETDGTKEKAELNKQSFELRGQLRDYLKKETQPVSWRKEELIHRAQYGTLQELNSKQSELETQEGISSVTLEHLLKEEATGDVELNLLKETEEVQTGLETVENDFLTELFSNVDGTSKEGRSFTEVIARENHQAYMPQAPELFEQMVEKFRMEIKPGVTQMEISLYPEELGQLQLKVAVEKGVLTAHFIAESVRVKEIIEQNLSQLKDTFAREGMHWEQITVDVGQDGLQENPFLYQEGREFKDQRRSAKRQNFKDSITEEIELSEAEAVSEEVKDPNRIVDYRV